MPFGQGTIWVTERAYSSLMRLRAGFLVGVTVGPQKSRRRLTAAQIPEAYKAAGAQDE